MRDPALRGASRGGAGRAWFARPILYAHVAAQSTPQEPRLERIMSEIRTQRKRAQAAQAASADSPPGLNPLG